MKRKVQLCIRYYSLVIGNLSLSFMIFAVSLLSTAQAHDNWTVEGAHGNLYVSGALTESACRLDMQSAFQNIQLENIGTGSLPKVGSQGRPVTFILRLKDCLRNHSYIRDERAGSVLWSPDQPAVRVSFLAKAEGGNAELIRVQGASGIALRIRDMQGRDIMPGHWGEALLLAPGQNELAYSVIVERTASSLIPGKYFAVINLKLSYE
ncbi:fimbrial protein [Serratia ureilytica]|uniref:fimbrial protein n=1 Tax=Serratia ureilytica TaxID=300181 RepID=UPI0018E7B886|nr:fimbrial protein [Serratia ureilytica]MBJ2099155.1 type 1 fimbrial protein [Serratia ureilytica]